MQSHLGHVMSRFIQVMSSSASKQMQLVMEYNVNDRSIDSDWFKNDENKKLDFIWKDCNSGMPNRWKREDGMPMWKRKTAGLESQLMAYISCLIVNNLYFISYSFAMSPDMSYYVPACISMPCSNFHVLTCHALQTMDGESLTARRY